MKIDTACVFSRYLSQEYVLIQIYGFTSCNETKKAIRFLKERRIDFQFVNLMEKKLSKNELDNIFSRIPPEDCVNTKSRNYIRRGMQYMEYDARQELEEDQSLFVTPLLRSCGKVALGFDRAFLEEMA